MVAIYFTVPSFTNAYAGAPISGKETFGLFALPLASRADVDVSSCVRGTVSPRHWSSTCI